LNGFTFQKTIGTAANTTIREEDYQLGIYPNPSDSDVTLKYNLPSKSNVKIDVYSAQGQLIKSILRSNQDAGQYQNKISKLKPGSYVLKFNADKFSKSILFEVTK
jgi:uncharacterized membrane protein